VSPEGGGDILVTSPSRVYEPRPLLTERFNEWSAGLSPDGDWLAYTSDESGRDEVYVQPYPGPGSKEIISTDGGSEPVWSLRGREIVYRRGTSVMAVDVEAGPPFAAGAPRILFDGRYEPEPCCGANFDATADGERFVMIRRQEGRDLSQIHVIANWVEELNVKMAGTRR